MTVCVVPETADHVTLGMLGLAMHDIGWNGAFVERARAASCDGGRDGCRS
jgi:hypothetical protein